MNPTNYGIAIPMANEEADFATFVTSLKKALDKTPGGTAYLIIDKASHDKTPQLCEQLAKEDSRFVYIWAPENHNVVDAYLRGFKEALSAGHDYIIEMDGGGSHNPAALPTFIRALEEGNECAFGSRYINGGSLNDSPLSRRFLSKFGSLLAHILLGCPMKDVTSGYQAFTRPIIEKILIYHLRSKAHFYQTELRYLLKKRDWIEIPIHYVAPSPRVSQNALKNSLLCLFYYTCRRLTGQKDKI
ncbi:MAG: glycosyltransferase [Akkermansia sp.]